MREAAGARREGLGEGGLMRRKTQYGSCSFRIDATVESGVKDPGSKIGIAISREG
jgi:hypothetical protein